MRVLIGLAILATLALLAASPALYSFRRTRLGAALMAGGWVMVAAGFALGPHGISLIGAVQVQVSKPLMLFLLGWVGLVVGLQVDRRLPNVVPDRILRLSCLDAVLSLVVIGGGTGCVMAASGLSWRSLLPVACLLGIGGIGCSPETRSLVRGQAGLEAWAAAIRAVSGVGAIMAVIAMGLMVSVFHTLADAPLPGFAEVGRIALEPAVTAVMGVAMGLLGMWLMGIAGRDAGQFLVVLIGLVSLTVGAAAMMGHSPMFAALFAGAAVANLPGRSLEKFRRVVCESEQPIGTAMMLAAGLLIEPGIGVVGVAVVVAAVATRVAVKIGIIRSRLHLALRALTTANPNAFAPAALPAVPAAAPPVSHGIMQPNPLAIALAVGYVLSPLGQSSAIPLSGGEALTVVILTGLISEAWPYLPFHSRPDSTAQREGVRS